MLNSVRRARRLGAVGAAAALAVLVPGGGRATTGTWARVADIGIERSTPAVGAIGDDIYVFGGVRDDFRTNVNVFYNDLHVLDTGASPMTWTAVTPEGISPPPRAFAAAASDGVDKLYVFGGAFYGPSFAGFIAYPDLWAYSVSGNAWTRLGELTGGPQGRSRPNMWLVGDKLYVFGGVNSLFQTLDDLWAFDLTTQKWSLKAPPATPGTRHEALAGTAAFAGRLTVYGGERIEFLNGSFFELLTDTWAYDTGAGTWSNQPAGTGEPNPVRNYSAVGIIGDGMYVQGGDIAGGSQNCGAPFPQNPQKDVWRLDLGTHDWTQLSPLEADPLVALKRHVAAVVDGTMYILGGFDFVCDELTDPGQIWNHDVYAYTS